VIDRTNSLACMFDAVRCYKLAEDREEGGVLLSASACYCKDLPEQFPDDEARARLRIHSWEETAGRLSYCAQ